MNMKFNYILTFDTTPQEFGNGEINPFFTTKEAAVAYFKGMTASAKSPLIKVSICADTDNPRKLPTWFMEANGKLWADDLGTAHLIK